MRFNGGIKVLKMLLPLGILHLLLLSSCTRSPKNLACVPGAQVACACLGGTSGIQVCTVDGARYDSCVCEVAKHGPAPSGSPAQIRVASPAPCPVEEELNRRLSTVWKSSPSQVHLQKCVPGSFPAPGWAIVAWLERGGGVALRHAVLEQATDTVVASLDGDDTGIAQMDYNEFTSLRAIDLDSDGIAEILEEWVHSKGGRTSQIFSLYRLNGRHLQELLSEGVGYDSTAAYGDDEKDRIEVCEGIVTLTKELKIVIDVKLKQRRANDPPDCSPGHRVYKILDGKIIKSQ